MNDSSLPLETVLLIRDHCLCFAAQRVARLLARRFDRLLAPLGITNGQFSMLVALSGKWQPRLGELAEFLAMDPTTMTAAVKALEKKGFLALHADAQDARARRPALTRAGVDVVARAVPLWRVEHSRVESELPGLVSADMASILRQMG